MSEEEKDVLSEMIEKDLPRDVSRIKAIQGVDASKLQSEIAGTVLFHVRQLAKMMHEFRSWSYDSIMQLNSGLTEVEDRMDEVSGGGGTQFTPDDAVKFTKLVAGSKWMATELLKHGQNAEGTKKLQEFVDLATECEKIIDDGILEEIEEEDEEEDESDGSDDSEESSDPENH